MTCQGPNRILAATRPASTSAIEPFTLVSAGRVTDTSLFTCAAGVAEPRQCDAVTNRAPGTTDGERLLALAHQPLVAVEVVAVTFRAWDTGFGRAGGPPR